ncbi:MAG: MarR family transcriptional regulator [Porticoccaceae bacterium]|nr:MAG: MarR family transcriptional regulator [Porticoccaceae bacterium]
MDVTDRVLAAIRRIIRATDLHSRSLVRTTGLTAPQLLVLRAVEQRGECTVGELARAVSLSQGTVTTIVSRLEERGLLARVRGESDRRKVYVSLTETGRRALASSPQALQEKFAREFGTLQPWEQLYLLSALERIAHMMDADGIDASPVLEVGDLDRSPPA